MIADLRSDTVTRPTPAMLDAMMSAVVGDDVFGDDPTVNKLESLSANMLGMEAAVFCPSGTMSNQIGINILTRPFEEIICYKGAHIYKYEGGGLAGNSQLSVRLVEGNRGRLSASDVRENVNLRSDPHQPITSLVAMENSVVREAGACYTIDEMASVAAEARKHGLRVHLDGARLFNALVATGGDAGKIGIIFDTVSICLSKGLGAPIGSILLCSRELEPMARRRRKSMGGGMRQAGYLAAAGIYALQNNISRLQEDQARATALANILPECGWVKSVMPVDTNIVILELAGGLQPSEVLSKLAAQGVLAVAFGPRHLRMVTHLDFNDDHLEIAERAFKNLNP